MAGAAPAAAQVGPPATGAADKNPKLDSAFVALSARDGAAARSLRQAARARRRGRRRPRQRARPRRRRRARRAAQRGRHRRPLRRRPRPGSARPDRRAALARRVERRQVRRAGALRRGAGHQRRRPGRDRRRRVARRGRRRHRGQGGDRRSRLHRPRRQQGARRHPEHGDRPQRMRRRLERQHQPRHGGRRDRPRDGARRPALPRLHRRHRGPQRGEGLPRRAGRVDRQLLRRLLQLGARRRQRRAGHARRDRRGRGERGHPVGQLRRQRGADALPGHVRRRRTPTSSTSSRRGDEADERGDRQRPDRLRLPALGPVGRREHRLRPLPHRTRPTPSRSPRARTRRPARRRRSSRSASTTRAPPRPSTCSSSASRGPARRAWTCSPTTACSRTQYSVPSSSILDPGASTSVFTAGAICFQNDSLEPYSSQGPTIDGRIKPDIAGQDAVTSGVYGPFSTCGSSGFTGTSAASPHTAGAAALVKQVNPSLTRGAAAQLPPRPCRRARRRGPGQPVRGGQAAARRAQPPAHRHDRRGERRDRRGRDAGGHGQPAGRPTSYRFQFGPTAAYGSQTAAVPAGAGDLGPGRLRRRQRAQPVDDLPLPDRREQRPRDDATAATPPSPRRRPPVDHHAPAARTERPAGRPRRDGRRAARPAARLRPARAATKPLVTCKMQGQEGDLHGEAGEGEAGDGEAHARREGLSPAPPADPGAAAA